MLGTFNIDQVVQLDYYKKCVPPSLIMARGIPNRLKIFFVKNFITVLWSLFQLGIASIHFET